MTLTEMSNLMAVLEIQVRSLDAKYDELLLKVFTLGHIVESLSIKVDHQSDDIDILKDRVFYDGQ
jgi:hypothetical protein